MQKSLSSPPVRAEQGGENQASPSSIDAGAPPSELDVMLPKACEGLVLITQCITTVALEAEKYKGNKFDESVVGSNWNLKDYFTDIRYDSQGLVENLIGMFLFRATPTYF